MLKANTNGNRYPRPGKCTLIFLAALIIALLVSSSLLAQTPIGPGNAGQVHAVAFDPENVDAIYAGGDVCGVYQSLDHGLNWDLWSDGLDYQKLSYSYYVDDLLVVRGGNADAANQGVYAATWAGIFFRSTTGGPWISDTHTNTYDQGYADLYFPPAGVIPIPFSSLAYDPVGGVLYAGAGHGRIVSTDRLDQMYPEAPTADTPGQYSLWKCNLAGESRVWEAVLETEKLGMVRQISVINTGGVTQVLFATKKGVFSYSPSPTPSISDIWHEGIKSMSTLGWSQDAWGVAAGAPGYVYALMSKTIIVDDEGNEIPATTDTTCVYRLELAANTWSRVGDTDAIVYPHDGVTDIGGHNDAHEWRDFLRLPTFNLSTLLVLPGATPEADQVFVGNRSTVAGAGIFRYGPYQSTTGPATGWVHTILGSTDGRTLYTVDYNNPAGLSWVQLGVEELGWSNTVQPVALVPMIVHPANPNRMVAFAYQIPLISDNEGSSWTQIYCLGATDSWTSRGLNLMCATESEFMADGSLLLGNMDMGVFKGNPGNHSFSHLLRPVGGWPWARDVEVVNKEGVDEIYTVANHYYASEKNLPDIRSGRSIAYYDPLGAGTEDEWDRITADINDYYLSLLHPEWNLYNKGHYNIIDCEFVNEDTTYAICMFDEIGISDGDTTVVDVHPALYRGVRTPVVADWEWDWTLWWGATYDQEELDGLEVIERIPRTRKLLVSAIDARGVAGGLFCLDMVASNPPVQAWLRGAIGTAQTNLQEVTENITCIAPDEFGQVVYLGSRGPAYVNGPGRGAVLRFDGPFDGTIPTPVILANEDVAANTFGFQLSPGSFFPVGYLATIQGFLTNIQEIEIDPNNPYNIYAAVGDDTYHHEKYGVWNYKAGVWTQLTGDAAPAWPFNGQAAAPMTMAINKQDPGTMFFGTAGQEYFEIDILAADHPVIAEAAEFPILAHNADASCIAVEVVHPSGYHDMIVEVDLSLFEMAGMDTLLDDGVYPDLLNDDGIYSAMIELDVAAGDHYLPVFAQAPFDPLGETGDGSYAFEDSVLVVAISGVMKVSEASAKTGDLKTTLSGNPYSEIYFDTPVDGVQENVLLVTKDNAFAPQVFRKKEAPLDGAPDFQWRDIEWFGGNPPIGGGRGICVANVDGNAVDSDEDIFICNNGTNPQLLLNSGGGFIDGTSSFFGSDVGFLNYSHVAAWGDYNNDGFMDLAVASLDAGHSGYTMADFDANPGVGSTISLFRGSGDALTRVTHSAFPTDLTVLSLSWRDVSGDGNQDLVIFDFDTANSNPVVMLNQGRNSLIGDYTFISSLAWGLPGSIRTMAWTDFNHDLRSDILAVTNGTPNGVALLLNNGTSFSSPYSSSLLGIYESVLVGDVDQDGQDDVGIIPSQGPLVYRFVPYYTTGVLAPQDLAMTLGLQVGNLAVGDYASGGALADFNDDHDLDILLGRPSNLPFFFRNVRGSFDSAGAYQLSDDVPVVGEQNWLDVDLVSVGGVNRSCLGTKVVVKQESGDLHQWSQIVDGGSGRGGQNPNQLHFGLGAYSGTVQVEVYWPLPGSTPEIRPGQTLNQVLTIPELANKSGDCITIYDSLTFSHSPFPGGSDWVFEWETDVKGDFTQDEVTWEYREGEAVGESCLGSYPCTLSWGDPDVEASGYYRKGRWRHHLVWKNQICSSEPCPFEFRVRSGYDNCTAVSNSKTFGDFGVCISE